MKLIFLMLAINFSALTYAKESVAEVCFSNLKNHLTKNFNFYNNDEILEKLETEVYQLRKSKGIAVDFSYLTSLGIGSKKVDVKRNGQLTLSDHSENIYDKFGHKISINCDYKIKLFNVKTDRVSNKQTIWSVSSIQIPTNVLISYLFRTSMGSEIMSSDLRDTIRNLWEEYLINSKNSNYMREGDFHKIESFFVSNKKYREPPFISKRSTMKVVEVKAGNKDPIYYNFDEFIGESNFSKRIQYSL